MAGASFILTPRPIYLSMPGRKRRSIFDLFSDMFERDFEDLIPESTGSYSITVYTGEDGKVRVRARVSDGADAEKLLEDLRRRYGRNADIEIETPNGKVSNIMIRFVDDNKKTQGKGEGKEEGKKSSGVRIKFTKSGKTLIREIE